MTPALFIVLGAVIIWLSVSGKLARVLDVLLS